MKYVNSHKLKKIILSVLVTVFCFGMITGCSKEKKAANGDIVIVDYEGYLDGKQFEGGTDKNCPINLGSHTFIDGFEDQIVGHKVGENFDINVTFPADYPSEELKGKSVVFKVSLHEIWQKVASDLK